MNAEHQSPISIDVYCIGYRLKTGQFSHAEKRWESGNFAYNPAMKDGTEPSSSRWVRYGRDIYKRNARGVFRRRRRRPDQAAWLDHNDNYVGSTQKNPTDRQRHTLDCGFCTLKLVCRDERLGELLDDYAARGVSQVALADLVATLTSNAE
jgi:hypothetical protein